MALREIKDAAEAVASFAKALSASEISAGEATVNVAHAPACRGEGDIRGVRQLVISGNVAEADKLYDHLLTSGQCLRLRKGTRVFVESISLRGMAIVRIHGDPRVYYMDAEQVRATHPSK